MTREEAITELISVWKELDNSRCRTPVERRRPKAALCEALMTLGVSEEELVKRGFHLAVA